MADERARTGLHERAEQEGGASLEHRGADESPRTTSARRGDERDLLHCLRSSAKALCLIPSVQKW
jgi:hypothetical protein